MEVIVAASIAVVGWLVNHRLSIRAQRKHFLNDIRNKARLELIQSLRKYVEALDEFAKSEAQMLLLVALPEKFTDWKASAGNNISLLWEGLEKFEMEPECIRLLEEYEPLFSGTIEARKYFRKKHIDLKFEYGKSLAKLRNGNINVKAIEAFTLEGCGYKRAAQRWIARDFIVCLQNISLGQITGHMVSEAHLSKAVRHPRLRSDGKSQIQVVPGWDGPLDVSASD